MNLSKLEKIDVFAKLRVRRGVETEQKRGSTIILNSASRVCESTRGIDSVLSDGVLKGLYSFCPELLLEEDNDFDFSPFNKLVRVLERSGALSNRESKSAVDEILTYFVEVWARHVSSGRRAEEIENVVEVLLSD